MFNFIMLESTASGTVDIKNRLYSETEHMRIYSNKMFYKTQPTASTKPAIFADVWRRNPKTHSRPLLQGLKTKVGSCRGKSSCLTGSGLIRGHPLILKPLQLRG